MIFDVYMHLNNHESCDMQLGFLFFGSSGGAISQFA